MQVLVLKSYGVVIKETQCNGSVIEGCFLQDRIVLYLSIRFQKA